MRRSLVVGTTVLAVLVLAAAPAARRGLSARVESAADGLRRRVSAFREDYTAREAELRERLLPDEAVVDAARHRTAESR